MKVAVMNNIPSAFMPLLNSLLVMGGSMCFQAQTAARRCLHLSVYQKDGIKQKGLMRFRKKAEGDLDIK